MTPLEIPDSNPWDIPNGVDRCFSSQFRDRHRGQRAIVLCNSPWLAQDVKETPAGWGEGARIGVHLAALAYETDYCLSAGDARFLALVNPHTMPRCTFVLPCVETVLAWASGHRWPANIRLYTSPPILPTGTLEPQRTYPRPWQGHNLSGPAALWLAWFTGANPVRLCGCHCRPKDGALTWYDADKLRQLIPDPAERERHALAARTVLPDTARKTIVLVDTMRADGVDVDWPGEPAARQAAAEG